MEEISATVKKNAENAQQANQSASDTRDGRRSRRPGGRQGGRGHGADRGILAQDLRHHRRDRRDRPADQPAGAQRRGGSRARRRSRPRLRGGRLRSAQPGAALLAGGQGHQGPDHQLATVRSRTASISSTGPAPRSPRSSSRSRRWPTIVADIANASAEQATGIEQVNKALTQMDEVTQQNSALVEENAATAKTLEHQAKAMDERVAFFQLDDGGDSRSAPLPPAASAASAARKATGRSRGPADVRVRAGRCRRWRRAGRPHAAALATASARSGLEGVLGCRQRRSFVRAAAFRRPAAASRSANLLLRRRFPQSGAVRLRAGRHRARRQQAQSRLQPPVAPPARARPDLVSRISRLSRRQRRRDWKVSSTRSRPISPSSSAKRTISIIFARMSPCLSCRRARRGRPPPAGLVGRLLDRRGAVHDRGRAQARDPRRRAP